MTIDELRSRNLKGKHIVVMGLGLHGGGLATARWLLRHGATVLVTDLRTRFQLATTLKKLHPRPRLRFVLGEHRHKDFASADCIVQNPGVPNLSPFLATARKHHVPIVNEATLFFLHCPCPVIGVTGTKGKSTVSTMVAHLLRPKYPDVVLAGNIASKAMLDVLDHLRPSSLVVAELSSWQLEGLVPCKRSPHIALVTNVLDDHLNRYASRAAYAAAKALIWRYQRPNDVVILNRDNPRIRPWGGHVRGQLYWYGSRALHHDGAYRKGSALITRLQGRLHSVALVGDLRVPGVLAWHNALPAILVARLFGVRSRDIRRSLSRFRGLPGRLEYVRTVAGVEWYNDTTATAPSAAVMALNSFPRKIILIAGGVDKALPYDGMARAIRQHVKTLVLFPGSASDKLRFFLRKIRTPIREVGSMLEAVTVAHSIARKGDVVVLSPGAASFNLFLHEFDRGAQFVKAVKALTP